jgi:hypothetical protein
MNRRSFLQKSVAAASLAPLASAVPAAAPRETVGSSRPRIAAYYLRAHMYTCVPRQVRDDLQWMADKGTDYVCVGVLEQDLFAAQENHALVISEAARAGLRVLAVPSRWAGLTAGAPKVPSLFSVAHPDTWMVNKKGTTHVSPQVSGVISSIHHPKTLAFFCETLAELYRQHPALAGFIIDEPKCFNVDTSKMAVAALGAEAPLTAHLNAAGDFFSRVCRFAKDKWPDKLTLMFQKADNHRPEELAAGGGVGPLDYYGCDGRPWTLEEDAKFPGGGAAQESGKGKVLLSGVGQKFIDTAHRVPGRGAFFLAENHNLSSAMIAPLERHYAAALALRPEMFAYYYYPRNVDEPDRVMEIIGRELRRFRQAG